VFEFVYATNDNMDGTPVTLLASKTLANLGITAGTWVNFSMWIDPNASASNRLVVKLNNAVVYQGDIPTGGPVSGAFQVGFRENHTGSPVAKEGTWIDNVTLDVAPSVVDAWSLSDREIKVVFDKDVDLASAQTVTNYFMSGVTFDTATRDGSDHKVVVIHSTAAITGDRTADTLTVNNIQPDGGGPGCIGQTAVFYAGLTAINNIQPNTGTPLNSAYWITTRGIVSAKDASSMVWIADASGANRGLVISGATLYSQVASGDQITVVGKIQESGTVTTLATPVRITTNSTGNPIYAAAVVTCSNIEDSITADANPAEQYEGMLVRINNAVIVQPWDFTTNYYFEISTDGGINKAFVDDGAWYHFGGTVPIVGGGTYTVTGIVSYSGGQYTLNPRSAADISLSVVPVELSIYDLR
ncbi:MAG TPA: hypothetical protein PLB62_08075, partial [Candidatus Sumerlaeota bacterium]|nr:hypothetical protein [Candidatus Sumerlaeota bacterium]